MIVSIWRNLWCLSAGKKSTSSFTFSWDIPNLLQICYIGHFGNIWLRTPKMTVWSCRKTRCLSACQKCYMRYYILKNLANWSANSMLAISPEPKCCQIWHWLWNINNNISFYFGLFPGSNENKIFQKTKKNLLWGHFGSFSPNFYEKEFSWKKGLYQFLIIPIYYHRVKK